MPHMSGVCECGWRFGDVLRFSHDPDGRGQGATFSVDSGADRGEGGFWDPGGVHWRWNQICNSFADFWLKNDIISIAC